MDHSKRYQKFCVSSSECGNNRPKEIHKGIKKHLKSDRTCTRKAMPCRTLKSLLQFTVLQFLLLFVHGQGPGNILSFSVFEEIPPDSFVGKINTTQGFQYRFSTGTDQVPFNLNKDSGEITTSEVIDRESLQDDTFKLVVTSFPDVHHVIEVSIQVLDINDNYPIFGNSRTEVSFSEEDTPGTQVILETATDRDVGKNDVTKIYTIVSGNEESKFKLWLQDTSKPLLYLENTVKLDREIKQFYTLNISAQDGGDPTKYGYLSVDIKIRDYNDNSPLFDQSEYNITINETVPIGTSIIQVTATDPDHKENAYIRYEVLTFKDQFWIEPTTGDIRTLKKLDCKCDSTDSKCKPNSCRVTVEAKDGGQPPQSGRAYVTVSLIDENDHDPSIKFNKQTVKVDEGAKINDVVTVVTVTDLDEGENSNTSVKILKGNERSHFKMEKISRSETSTLFLIRVNSTLDREKVNKYNLTIQAKDNGTPQRSSSSHIVILVEDVNDHKPIFLQSSYFATLSELVPIGSFVIGITAMDNDTGANALLTYSIVSGNDLGWFQINSATGLITTKKLLDNEKRSVFRLKIRAQDNGATTYSSQINITININDENDEVPKFSKDVYHVNLIEEGQPGPLPGISTTAVDHDQGKNGTVTYQLHQSVNKLYPDMFTVNANTGSISTLKIIDREVLSKFELILIAKDQGIPSLSSTAKVIVTVQDINDNSQIFYPVDYFANVLENQPASTLVTKVTASDKDEGDNGTVRYTIYSGSASRFQIDRQTGVITTTKSISKAQYSLLIKAEDIKGSQTTQMARVKISVVSPQDLMPVFNKPTGYTFSITETNNTGINIGTVAATFQQVVLYSIVGGDPNGNFLVDQNTGTIKNAKSLDREQTSAYSLVLVAKSGSAFAETIVNVSVADINDNSPEFSLLTTNIYFNENIPVGKGIVLAKANDPDFAANARIIYSLGAGASDIFAIDQNSGLISLAKHVTSFQQSSFELKVVAKDSGSPIRSSSVDIILFVTDVNDHTPAMNKTNYEVALLESLPVNDRFFQLTAVDLDDGLYGQIIYEIVSGNEDSNFGIFPDGVLYIAKHLDRETKDLFVLKVRAGNLGPVPRDTFTNVTIHILDSNDNDPVFTNDTFHFNLVENSDIGTFIGKVVATDADSGKNRELSFSLEGVHQGFEIATETGAISSIKSFDREALLSERSSNEITLSVVVTDNGENGRRSSKATVVVTIQDANDMVPVFSTSMYDKSIFEMSDKDSSVIRVSATDSDIELNSKIEYSIIDGNDGDIFNIDSESGLVTLKGVLDREVQDLYQLTIMAKDSGAPSLHSYSILRVKILDSNDNSPLFMDGPRLFNLSESAERRFLIATFTATDQDTGNNGIVDYSITKGNINRTFNITKTGKLILAGYLDFDEKTKVFDLDITARDKGQQNKRESTIQVKIVILDENDCTPTFTTQPIVREIKENIAIGTSVVTVTATDLDSGLNSEVKYSLVKQVPQGTHFTVEADTGLIKTADVIDREFSNNFKITIKATDMALPESTRLYSEKVVQVLVSDINDNGPKFISQTAVSVMVNATPNTIITQIKATDADEGRNAEVEYTITSGDTNVFSLHSTSGKLYLRSSLDPRVLSYPLSVQAKDKGSPQKVPKAFHTMTVFVRLNNENGPLFTKSVYDAQITENMAESIVITVSARYTNGGSNNNIEYYITKVTANNTDMPRYFDIKDPGIGTIRTTDQILDREIGYEVYNVEVTAVDTTASQPSTRSTIVHVTILDENDSPPVFNPDTIEVTVSEAMNPGDKVTTVTATDPDKIGSLFYSIVSGANGKFSIDPAKGELSLLSKLDRETKSKYTVTVGADDGVQMSHATVTITVTDVNDEKPQFLQHYYYFDIPENTEAGSIIAEISAIDRDEGDNALLTYSIQSHWGRPQFALHPYKGEFQLIHDLDYEQVNHYILTVKAQDSGPNPKSSTATVYMSVIDENDNPPIFDPSSYSVEVWENATVGASLMQVSATDLDSGANGQIEYSVIKGDSKGVFSMDKHSGVLSMAGQLDRETQSFYHVDVEAVDQTLPPGTRMSITTGIDITVRDVNDNGPKFTIPSVITAKEHSNPGTTIYTITTIDIDQGQNGAVLYTLVTSAGRLFSIGQVNGKLKVEGDLDRETKDTYNITIRATDKGSPPNHTDFPLTIRVGDINDHSPVFNPKVYSKTLSENTNVGTSLFTLSATDSDIGINGDVRYVIVKGDDTQSFYLDSHTGVFSINSPLDYESKQNYQITVMAYDLGNPQRSDTASVTIGIGDVNDCQPAFLDVPYVVYVQENVANTPVYVTQVKAYDCDSGYNAMMSFSITEGSQNGLFSIDSQTGVVNVNQALDREEVESYEMVVTALDSGSIPRRLSSSVSVLVIVSDANDNTPTFEHAHYRGIVKENLQAPVHIATVTAVDLDGSENGQIRYTLVSDGKGQFSVDTVTGEITTTRQLDREVTSQYTLTVMAEDNGMLARSSTVEVSVKVTDDNDNSPKFMKNPYNVVIRDPTTQGSFIVGVTALDLDSGVNSHVKYSLVGGGDTASFNINSDSGVITASRRLTRSTQSSFQLSVRATDEGANTTPDTTTVAITFLTQTSSSNFPSFASINQNIPLEETFSTSATVATVKATSTKLGAVLSYHIAGGNIKNTFTVDQSGKITPKHALDYEEVTKYNLWIEARDSSANPPLSSYLGFDITVIDMNDSPPVFDKLYYNASVNEVDQPPVNVIAVTASDADSGENGKITYELVGGNEKNHFAINVVGEIRTQVKLDREELGSYKLVVTAMDHGSPKNTATATIDIEVADFNDLGPKFTRHFSSLIPENAPIGTQVLKITTNDGDIGANAIATYKFVDEEDMFAIDHITGWITLTGRLDRDKKETQYLLKVKATDTNHQHETNIIIYILDVNDNAPVFINDNNAPVSSYSFGVANKEAVGKVIGKISAIDDDGPGLNSEVWYRMKYPQSEFSVNAVTGEIKTLEVMKYMDSGNGYTEDNIKQFYVNAFDRGDPVQSSQVLVTVNITPSNQHAPSFDKSAYSIPVAENSPMQLSVGQVSASDDDIGDNGEIVYTSVEGNGTQYFHVDPVTGKLRVVGSLTGLRTTLYVLKVKAKDLGNPSRSSTVQVTFKVIEKNSFSPEFVSDQVYTADVAEDSQFGHTVMQVVATDQDEGLNGQVSYYITGGNEEGHFAIDVSSGKITVLKPLDYETKKEYQLTVTARDKGPIPNELNHIFTVSVTDVNDYPPTFKLTHYDAYVAENLPTGAFVHSANAIDLDANLAGVEYYITGDEDGIKTFRITKASGDIFTKAMLDYEVKPMYSVVVKALNPGTSLSGTATINVHVSEVNEFAPSFKQSRYDLDVQESAPVKTEVGSVNATDQDKGIYGIVEYYLVGDSNLKEFAIDTHSGSISVVGKIIREVTPEIVLTVVAKNSGPITDTSLLDFCKVNIRVGDANDPPRFTQSLYEKNILENAEVANSVIQVTANDKDLNNANSQFYYSIENGNVGNAFQIGSGTGLITVAANLDRETVAVYTMTVAATDSGSPPKTGRTSVKVYLDDINDNGPYFIPTIPTANLTENQPTEVAIDLKEVTFDLDIGLNKNQIYQYQLVDHTDKFEVGVTSGLVKTKDKLDREQVPEYLVKLKVTDSGSPPMSSTLTLKIEVIDQNDNPSSPRNFHVDVYSYAGQTTNGAIGNVRPSDPDIEGSYQCQLITPANPFSIPTACNLHASGNIIYGQKYTIDLTGSDGIHSKVTYQGSVVFKQFDQEMVDNSFVLRLANKPVTDFLAVYNTFVNALVTITQGQGTVEVYSMTQSGTDLDLFISPKQVNGKVLTRNALVQAIITNKASIESQTSCVIKNVNYNPCSNSPCKNGGECSGSLEVIDVYRSHDSSAFIFTSTSVLQKFICTCTEEYTGQTCEEAINKCQKNPCKNQGTCSTNNDGSFKCSCTNKWEGSTCEQDINECLIQNPCQNGGTCRNKPGSYSCDCLPSFTGNDCNVEVKSCSLKPCKNSGICQDKVNGGFTCVCKYGFRGHTCEIESKGFETLSFMEFSQTLDQSRNTFDIEFATVKQNALLLLYSSQSTYEFLALEIIAGQVQLSFSLGNEKSAVGDDVVRMISPVDVANGQWYSIVATRDNKAGSLKVSQCQEGRAKCDVCQDSDTTCSIQANGGKYQVLDAADSSLYLGGVSDISTLTSHPNQVNSHDFIGCMRSVQVDGLDLFQLTPKQTNGTSDKCPRAAAGGVCKAGVCGAQGVCVDQWSSRSCQCPKNKTGLTCSEEVKQFSMGLKSVVQYSVKPSYKRNLVLGSTTPAGRRRRAVDQGYSFSLTFKTFEKSGLILHAQSGQEYLNAYMTEGIISCRTAQSTVTVDKKVNEGEWQNLTITQSGTELRVQIDSLSASGQSAAIPHGLWDSFSLGSTQQDTGDMAGFKGCVSDFLVNGDSLPLSGYSNKFTIVSSDGVTSTCTEYIIFAGKDGPPSQIVIIVICTLFAFILIGVLLAFVVIVYHRRKKEKKEQPAFQNGSAMFGKHDGSISGKTKNNDSGRSHPDSGIAEEEFINDHIHNELNTGVFQEREIRGSLNSNRPDIVAQEVIADRNPEESDDGFENNGYSDGPPEHYDLDNASSIAPSDLLDFTQHYKRYRMGQLPAHNNKYKGGHKHMHHRHTPSPSVLANRQSPASVSVQMGRQSPADMLGGRMTPQKSQLTVENVNQLNRQTPVNQLSRASPTPNNIPIGGRDRIASPLGPTSIRSTPLSGISGLYPSNISNSTSYSETSGLPNGHIRRPNSKLKQPINQVGLRNTPTKGLTIEEVNRLNARDTPPRTLDVISSSSEEDVKNNINQTDFTHSDLLEPSNSMLPPESSSEEETNDSFTCSEFEDDQKIRNDRIPPRNFQRLPRVNEHDDTDTTLNSRGRNMDTDSNRESHTSTFFTASEEDFPRKIGKTKFPNNLIGLDSLLNWGTNYNKLVGVFQDIAHLSQPELTPVKRAVHNHSDSGTGDRSRPPSRASQSASPRPYLPPKPGRVASPGMRVMGQGASLPPRHKSHLPPSPLVPKHGLLNGHIKQSSIASIASSHDRQSSISSVQSSRSGRPVPNHQKQLSSSSSHLQVPNHSRSSSRSSLSSANRQPIHNSMYNPLNPQPPPPPPSIAQAIQVVDGKANSPPPIPAREEYV